ncbi:MAG: hypothetical protein IJT12_03000 [Paludibacteraceae bacterium]|nr:hypothetical protein [Paludibacteraceae bacterium]
MTDQEYIAAFRSNDQRAITAFYDLHREAFCKQIGALFRVLDMDSLYDVYIVTVTRLWEFIRKGKLTEQHLVKPLPHYLYGIGKHVMQETLRKSMVPEERAQMYRIELEEDLRIDTSFVAQLERVKRVVNQMGEPCEPLLTLYLWEKQPMDIIAFNLDYKNADSAKAQKYKCMEKLKRIIYHQL